MPQVQCPCGEVLDRSKTPDPNEWLCIPASRYAKLPDRLELTQAEGLMNSFLKCPSCGRLLVFWAGGWPEVFVPEKKS